MKSLKFILFASFILLFSCRKVKPETAVSIFGFQNMSDARQQLGSYADLFTTVSGSVFVSSTKFYSSEEEDWDIFARFVADPLSQNRVDGGEFHINERKLLFDKVKQTYVLSPNNDLSGKELGKLLKSNFGKENEAKLLKDGKTIFQTTAYIPNEIVASNLSSFEKYTGSNFIKLGRKGMNIQWNRDEKNTNGVVAYLSWTGDNVDLPVNEQGTQGKKDIAAKFDDTGEATIPSTFFEGLPKNAAFTISFIRGGVVVKAGSDNNKYKFYSNSWYKVNCVLAD